MPYRVSSSTFIHPLSYDNLIEWRWKISFVLSGCKYRINSINEEIFHIFFCRYFSATDCIDFIINSLNPIDRFGLKKASPALYALDLPKMLELFFKLGILFVIGFLHPSRCTCGRHR